MNEDVATKPNPVDEMLPAGKLFAYGLQHVLAMYAGAVAVPIIIAQALHLSPAELVHLINADLFSCGVATLIQTLGFWKVGARIPMIQGVTFAAVTPMILIGTEHGITAIYGAILIAGLFTFFIAPFLAASSVSSRPSSRVRSSPSSASLCCRSLSTGWAAATRNRRISPRL